MSILMSEFESDEARVTRRSGESQELRALFWLAEKREQWRREIGAPGGKVALNPRTKLTVIVLGSGELVDPYSDEEQISCFAQALGLEGLDLDRFLEAAGTWRVGTPDERIS
jgi:hypothetical protein